MNINNTVMKKLKKRRWRHPLLNKFKSWISVLFRFDFLRRGPKFKQSKEKETFIQGLIRLNNQVNIKSSPSSSIKELVPFKMYKAKELLLELRQQKEELAKSDYSRKRNIN